jgi:hypothetical protein
VSSFPFSGKPLGVQTGLSVTSGAAVALTVPAGAAFAVLSTTQNVTWRDDGVDPTSSAGVLLTTTGTQPWVYASEAGLAALRFIAVSTTATINCAFYA